MPDKTPIAAGRQAAAIRALSASHAAKQDSLVPPVLQRSGADLAAILAREYPLAGSGCAA